MLDDENGQTLVEHSLLIGGISSSIAVFRDHFILVLVAIIILLGVLLFWKPKFFAAIVLTAVILGILLFVYRWVENGHL
jgi:hypothetical protein